MKTITFSNRKEGNTRNHHEEEILSWLFRVAVKVHNDMKDTPGHTTVGNINNEYAQKVVPESLFMLIQLLCKGGACTDVDDAEKEVENRTILKFPASVRTLYF